jgi:neutral ceramidase
MLKIGVSKQDMTCELPNIGMLGYGKAGNVVKGISTRQYARAFVWQSDAQVFAYVCADICFVTDALKLAVLNHLENALPDVFSLQNVMLTAQHTHSGAGGFGEHFFYNLPFNGFQSDVLDIYSQAIAAAIVQAFAEKVEGKMQFSTQKLPDSETELGINRSLTPYNSNPEIVEKIKPADAAYAMDRTMKMLIFTTQNDELLGSINWLGVHTTSLSNDNTLVSADNKGYAAEYLEAYYNKNLSKNEVKTGLTKPSVHAFAQDTAGDITPNFVWDKQKKWTRGKYKNDIESAEHNGDIQYRLAKNIVEKNVNKAKNYIKTEKISILSQYIDFSQMQVAAHFTPNSEKNKRTAPSCIGVAMLRGTSEGPGTPPIIGLLTQKINLGLKWWELNVLTAKDSPERAAAQHKYEAQHPKSIVLEMQNRRLLLAAPRNLILPKWLDEHVGWIKTIDERGLAAQQDWLPSVFQIQIVVIGTLAILALPCELTTVAGDRLRKTALKALAKQGVEQVIVQSLANGYAGYATTFEEYQWQYYEGGHTPFGKWTLAALQTAVENFIENQAETDKIPLLIPKKLVWTE